MRISEARLNDWCYMMLKYSFFMHAGVSPRECDIRVCMDLSAPERIKSPMQAILMPDEKAGKSHDIFYDVDPERVFDECVTYIEDHWLKSALWTKKERAANKRRWLNKLIPALMAVEEEKCGVDA